MTASIRSHPALWVGWKGAIFMTDDEKYAPIRQYAAGETPWHALRERGFEDYVQVLGALGGPGPRPPVAAMTRPNVAPRQRGRALPREAPGQR